MSHFAVGVIVSNSVNIDNPNEVQQKINELLEPYDEDKIVPEYKKYINSKQEKRMIECYNSDADQNNLTREDMADLMKDYWGSRGGLDENGLYYMSTYNPDSKWDWWTIGGRWDGLLSSPSVLKNIKNYKTCEECNGSGKKNRRKCLYCNGEGVVLKTSSEWEEAKNGNIATISSTKKIIDERGVSFLH